EGYAQVASEHRFGRLYRLSDSDRESLQQAMDAVNGNQGGLRAVGLYRSNARDEFACTSEDEEYLAAHFPEDERLLLLIQPSRPGLNVADFFFWRDGRMIEAFRRFEFPFRDMPEDIAGAGTAHVPPSALPVEPQPVAPAQPVPVVSEEPAAREATR